MDSAGFDHILRLRLAVGRFGEMDRARWWDTHGMLAKAGRVAVGRGIARTHHFARARAVLAVAGARCREVYQPANGITLWDLPVQVEDRFEGCWPRWLDSREEWAPFFDQLEALPQAGLLESLGALGLLSSATVDAIAPKRRAADRRAVPLGAVGEITVHTIEQLAAGFCRGEPGQLAVPYATVGGAR